MGQYANFYNSINKDRVYDASSFEEWLKPFFKTGVFNGNLQVVESSGMNIKVGPGNAFIEGKSKCFDKETILTIDAAHATYSRIDNVIVRRNDADRDFIIMIQKGTNSNAPVAPTPIRQDGIYDIVLAHIAVPASAVKIKQENITDTRMNADICGWVVSNVEEVDFDQVTAQWADYIANFEADELQAFNAWFNTIKGKLSTDQAGSLQLQIDEQANNIATNKTNITKLKTVQTVTLDTSWPQDTTNEYYTQSVALSGITSNDNPTVDVVLSGTLAEMQAQQEEWGKILKVETSTNALTFYASEATTVSLSVMVKGV